MQKLNIPYNTKKGFSFTELLVVISIIGILITISIASFNTAQIKARDARRKSDLEEISKALLLAYPDKWASPVKAENTFPNGTCAGIAGINWGDEFKIGNTAYMKELPSDISPVAWDYCYDPAPLRNNFRLSTRLENDQDADIDIACDTHSGNSDYNYCIYAPGSPAF